MSTLPRRFIAAIVLIAILPLVLAGCNTPEATPGATPEPAAAATATPATGVAGTPTPAATAEVGETAVETTPVPEEPAPSPERPANVPAGASASAAEPPGTIPAETIRLQLEKLIEDQTQEEGTKEFPAAAAGPEPAGDRKAPQPAAELMAPPPLDLAAMSSRGPGSRPPERRPRPRPGATIFQDYPRSPTVATAEDAVSTFSLDTDRTSYRLALNWARAGHPVEPASVRAEEWINAFDYDYPLPPGDEEFAIAAAVFQHPLEAGKRLARLSFQAPEAPDDRRPVNVALVLDASGSMAEGNRVAIARAAAEALRQSLAPRDRIAVVHFTDQVIDHLTVAHRPPDHQAVRDSIARLAPHGATNVQAGLNLGVRLAGQIRQERPEAWHYVILFSDGVANVDADNPFAILETAHAPEESNPIRLVTIGVGIANYNDYLLEQLAQHGNGWYRYLDDAALAQETFRRENWLALAAPFADQTRAQVSWNPAVVRTWRLIGYENRIAADAEFLQDRKEFAELPAGAAATVFYELELNNLAGEGANQSESLGRVELRWVAPSSRESRRQEAVIAGLLPGEFKDLADPPLQLGALVALAADRYSALSEGVPGYRPEYPNMAGELRRLRTQLDSLEPELGHLTAYRDFRFLLQHLNRNLPQGEYREEKPGGSGYRP